MIPRPVIVRLEPQSKKEKVKKSSREKKLKKGFTEEMKQTWQGIKS